MADRRVRVPKDKEALIAKLTRSDDSANGVFQTKADLLTFAAVLAYSKKKTGIPFETTSEPIRQEVFQRSGYDTVINLLALATSRDPRCLANDDEAEELRVTIFEEYANAGLEFLRHELQGVDDPLDHLLLLIDQERRQDTEYRAFDLTDFLT